MSQNFIISSILHDSWSLAHANCRCLVVRLRPTQWEVTKIIRKFLSTGLCFSAHKISLNLYILNTSKRQELPEGKSFSLKFTSFVKMNGGLFCVFLILALSKRHYWWCTKWMIIIGFRKSFSWYAIEFFKWKVCNKSIP